MLYDHRVTLGPCGWVATFTHLSSADQTEWGNYPAATQSVATTAAARVLWSATGRQYGACSVIARPVLLPVYNSEAWTYPNPPWVPVHLDDDLWLNWPVSIGRIDPTAVKLEGPVSSITSVTIGNVVLSGTKYRLDQGTWLVRTDGNTWPLWQNTSLPGSDATAFVVTYAQGLVPPADLLAAAGTYALEYARAIAPAAGTQCRLPSRAKTITRQGITIDMVDPTVLLEKGLTGLPDVDAVILAMNPNRYIAPPRVLVPGGTARIVGA